MQRWSSIGWAFRPPLQWLAWVSVALCQPSPGSLPGGRQAGRQGVAQQGPSHPWNESSQLDYFVRIQILAGQLIGAPPTTCSSATYGIQWPPGSRFDPLEDSEAAPTEPGKLKDARNTHLLPEAREDRHLPFQGCQLQLDLQVPRYSVLGDGCANAWSRQRDAGLLEVGLCRSPPAWLGLPNSSCAADEGSQLGPIAASGGCDAVQLEPTCAISPR